MPPRIFRAKRSRGKGIYGGVIFLLVLVGFILQFQWMDRMKESGSTDVVPQAFAEKLKVWMLRKKGMEPDTLSTEAKAAEEIPCRTCMGSGTILTPEGERLICPICLGVGFHMVRRFDPADHLCPLCAGMGRVEWPDTGEVGTCPRCGGRGLVRSGTSTNADAPEME